MKKTLCILFLIFLYISTASAAIESIAGTNIFPDSEVRFRDTEVIGQVTSDSTTTTTVELWIQKPDETWFQSNGGQTVTVKQGNPRKFSLSIESDNLDQYGNYDIKLNETNNGLNSTIQTELVPRPDLKLSNPTNIEVNGLQQTYFNLDINTFVGEKIPLDELEPGNLTVYQITDDPNTTDTIEKTIQLQEKLRTDNNSGDLEAYIDTTALPEGSYELRADANITSCDVCEVYDTTTSDVVNIGNDYAYDVYNEKWGGNTTGDLNNNVDEAETSILDQVDNSKDNIKGALSTNVKSLRAEINSGGDTPLIIAVMILQVLLILVVLLKL